MDGERETDRERDRVVELDRGTERKKEKVPFRPPRRLQPRTCFPRERREKTERRVGERGGERGEDVCVHRSIF